MVPETLDRISPMAAFAPSEVPNQSFRQALDSLDSGVLICDADGRVLIENVAAASLHGLEAGQLTGYAYASSAKLSSDEGEEVAPEDHPLTRALAGSVVHNQRLSIRHDHEFLRPVAVSARPFSLGDHGSGALLEIHDETAQRERERSLTRLALHDPLTGLANRSLIFDQLTRMIARTRREKGNLWLILLDLDDFKVLNDKHGHLAGDEVLIEFARRFKRVARSSDVVGRLGGDEFVLFGMADVSAVDAVLELVANRVKSVFAIPYRVDGKRARLAASAGSVIADHRESVTTLLERADRAMYGEKNRRSLTIGDREAER